MNFLDAIKKTREQYQGARRGDAAARCALNEIEHYFICEKGQEQFPYAAETILWQRYLTDELGNGPSRANSKLSVLRQVFKVAGEVFPSHVVHTLPRSKAPKWILSDADEERLRLSLRATPLMLDYMTLVLETGLRVEEVLRLQLPMLHEKGGHYSLEAPGTKTAGSYDLIPITDAAAKVLITRSLGRDQFALLFDVSYENLQLEWQVCREFLKLTDNPTATLKGLRRTFAFRHRHLPPAILQRLLRHSNLQTTSTYLNVTGMNEELRGWLDGTTTILPARASPSHRVTDHQMIAQTMKSAGFTPEEVARALASI